MKKSAKYKSKIIGNQYQNIYQKLIIKCTYLSVSNEILVLLESFCISHSTGERLNINEPWFHLKSHRQIITKFESKCTYFWICFPLKFLEKFKYEPKYPAKSRKRALFSYLPTSCVFNIDYIWPKGAVNCARERSQNPHKFTWMNEARRCLFLLLFVIFKFFHSLNVHYNISHHPLVVTHEIF